MKIMIILLLIIIGACLAKTTLTHESFYGRGDDYYPHMFHSNYNYLA